MTLPLTKNFHNPKLTQKFCVFIEYASFKEVLLNHIKKYFSVKMSQIATSS